MTQPAVAPKATRTVRHSRTKSESLKVGQHQSQTDRAGDLHHEVDLHQIGRKNMQNAAEDQKQDIDRENGRDDTLGFGGYVIADGERKCQHGKCHNGGPGDG